MNILIDENLKIWKDSWKIPKNFIIISKVAFNYFYLLSLRILETREKFLEAEYPNRRKFENFNNSWKIREKLLVPSISMLDSFYFFFLRILLNMEQIRWIFQTNVWKFENSWKIRKNALKIAFSFLSSPL